jgi:hypothetical protein
MKYQLSITIGKLADRNSASTKAVKDCTDLFLRRGYKDYNLYFSEETNGALRYLLIFKALTRFYFSLQKNAVVGVQYPMLNNVFKYFIKFARSKNVRFFCIIHDIESLRLGGDDKALVTRELQNLNFYDYCIVHNSTMQAWLKENCVTKPMISLGVFDYLLAKIPENNSSRKFDKTIVFAGNLAKSNFIYALAPISSWKFNIYGPNFSGEKSDDGNVSWKGQYSPDEVVYKLDGDFGLIWDGNKIDECDKVLGNYLRYNNPHKFSLYLAAGLPVIAPKNSAIGKMIKELGLGILVDNLMELQNLQISDKEYFIFKQNCQQIRNEIIQGNFFLKAIDSVETFLAN